MEDWEREDLAGPMDARLQVPSSEWLKVHSLLGQNLSMDQILSCLGFKHKEGHVAALKSTVSSQYGDGLFTQQPNSKGQVYNLCGGSGERLEGVERRLQEVVALLKARHTWLNTGSRLHFGVVYGQQVVMVMDSCATEHAQLKPFLDVACDVLRDQFVHVDKFTVMRCTSGVECWNTELVKATSEAIADAVEWVGQTPPQTPPIRINVAEAIIKALAITEADNVYLITQDTASLRAFDLLLEKASPSLIPIHVVVVGCDDSQALDKYKQLAQVSGAKCHCYAPPTTPPPSRHPSIMSLSSAGSKSPPLSAKRPGSGRSSTNRPGSGRSSISRPGSASSSVLGRPTCSRVSVSFLPPNSFPVGNEDADLVWAELERARDTLADIQALCLEENVGAAMLEISLSGASGSSEDYMTSEQWLEVHGLKANKLTYNDLIGSLAFKHCNGRVQLPRPSKSTPTGSVEMIPHSKIVHAQYCKEFVHVRWEGERVVHIDLTDRIHQIFKDKVNKVLNSCHDRLSWLKQGSRELFGTLLEERIVVVIDTSSSMKDRLGLVKTKIQELINEQLKEKEKCSLFHFNSSVHAWRDHLVPTSDQNLNAISQWVEGLVAEGSTNTMAALSQAMSVRGAQAVYLLTDGRPDQPESEVLSKVQRLPNVPVHTISFNCADSKANYFLSQLSHNSGGRYYYYSEDVSDPEGPKTYESEDIHRLEREIECGEEQLTLTTQLLADCSSVRKGGKGRKTGKGKKDGVSKRTAASASGERKSIRFMGTRRWLEKNSLSALKLTLMDALGPSAIPHSAKDVPILDKKVTSKVFNSIFPLAHVANGNRVTLINPNGVDLKSYEERVGQQVAVYWERLTKLTWNAIPVEKRAAAITECGGEGSEVTDPLSLAYKDHKDALRNAMEDLGWPRPRINFDLLEAEIQQAENYIKYSVKLREEGRQGRQRRRSSQGVGRRKSRSIASSEVDGGSSLSILSSSSSNSLIELLDQLVLHTGTPSPLPPSTRLTHSSQSPKKCKPLRQNLRSQKVIARSSEDGFYYPGLVIDDAASRHVTVRLVDRQQISVLRRFVIPIGGSSPCPLLLVGDHVLAQVRTRKGPHPSNDGSCDYFIPGTIQVLPENIRKGHALHTVLVFNGRTVMCPRRGVVKITESLYKTICKFINAKMSASHSKVEQGSEYASDFSEDRSTPISQRSATQTPVSTSPAHSSPERTESRISDLKDGNELENGEEVDSGVQRVTSPHQVYEAEIKSLMENQQAQCELLERYQQQLAELQQRQREMEMAAKNKEDERSKTATKVEDIDAGERHLLAPDGEGEGRMSGLQDGNVGVQCREIAVNTGPWMEEKAVETDPMTESRGVGTEWSESSSSESETETEGEGDGGGVSGGKEILSEAEEERKSLDEFPSSETTPASSPLHVSTPSPSTPAHSATPSAQSQHTTPQHPTTPSPSHETTPSPSHKSTPSPSHETTPSPSHKSTPSPSHKSTPSPSHKTTPSPDHISTPVTSPSHHHHDSTPTKDLSSIAQRLVELGVDAFVGRDVLARWSDDGWYYRAKVVHSLGQHQYQVMDACDDVETMHVSDLITDTQDAEVPLQVGNTVVALHPDYAFSYAPGHVTAIHTTSDPGLHYSVQLYDGSASFLPRHEIYNLPQHKYQSDVEYLRSREKAWIGQQVFARSDVDGLYYSATVEGLGEGPGRYLVQWTSGETQEQAAIHVFGALTKRRDLRIEDYVIAQTHLGVCMPGQIKDSTGRSLQVEFCDLQTDDVDPSKNCFWVTCDYYQAAVEYISSAAVDLSSTHSLTRTFSLDRSEIDLTSEYSASYIQ